jgi:CMP-N-acetylneuraminic acid synthetase
MRQLSPPTRGVIQPKFDQTYNVMRDVLHHADREMWTRDIDPDAWLILQPTSPLRTAQDVQNCVTLLDCKSVDSVVSVTQGADDIAFQARHAGRLERIPGVLIPNGAIFGIKTSVLRAGGHWYGDHAYSYLMPKERSIDIDCELDLEMARVAWERLYGAG